MNFPKPSEVDLAELSHEYFKDAVSTAVKSYHFLQVIVQ